MIDSTAEFHAVIGAAVSAALVEVIERVYKELQKEIQKDIYSAYSPTDYERTEGLLTSWRKQVGGLDADLWFDPPKLPRNPDAWQHSSQYAGGDTRSQILDIIAGGYNAYNAHSGKPIPARPMWDNFMRVVEANLDKWIRSALRHQGLVVPYGW